MIRQFISIVVLLIVAGSARSETAWVGLSNGDVHSVDITVQTVGPAIDTTAVNTHGIAVCPGEEKVFITGNSTSAFFELIPATSTVLPGVAVPSNPLGVAVNNDCSKVYVTSGLTGKVTFFDVASGVVTQTVSTGGSPQGVVVSPDRSKVYVATTGFVKELEASSGAILASYALGANLVFPGTPIQGAGIEISPDGNLLYVAGNNANIVAIVDLIASSVTQVPVGSDPVGIALSSDGRWLYASNSGSRNTSTHKNSVTKIDLTGVTATSSIAVGLRPQGISLTADNTVLVVANTDSNSVSFVDNATNTVQTVAVSGSPISFGRFIAPPEAFDALDVEIDIKPGSFPNVVNLGSGGNTPVAIFGSATFDATRVDPATVTLASAPVKYKGNGNPQATIEDVNNDGFLDMLVHVTTNLMVETLGAGVVLEGQTITGENFTGTDTIKVVP